MECVYHAPRDCRFSQPFRSRYCFVQSAIIGKKDLAWIGRCSPLLTRVSSTEAPGEEDRGAFRIPVGKVTAIVRHIQFVAASSGSARSIGLRIRASRTARFGATSRETSGKHIKNRQSASEIFFAIRKRGDAPNRCAC